MTDIMTRQGHKMIKTIKSANGMTGCLILTFDGEYEYMIRFYHDDGTFDDCDIAHSDMMFKILDEDAYLYEDETGRKWIDHSPETLGLENK